MKFSVSVIYAVEKKTIKIKISVWVQYIYSNLLWILTFLLFEEIGEQAQLGTCRRVFVVACRFKANCILEEQKQENVCFYDPGLCFCC